MDHTEQQKQSIRDEFKRRRRRQIILIIPVVLAVIGMMNTSERYGAAVLGLPAEVAAGGFFVLVLGALAFSLFNWRCPACSGYLGKSISPRFCSKCGVSLGEPS